MKKLMPPFLGSWSSRVDCVHERCASNEPLPTTSMVSFFTRRNTSVKAGFIRRNECEGGRALRFGGF